MFVWRRDYLSNMAPTSALCALCIQSQCIIKISLHSYIVITVLLLYAEPVSHLDNLWLGMISCGEDLLLLQTIFSCKRVQVGILLMSRIDSL